MTRTFHIDVAGDAAEAYFAAARSALEGSYSVLESSRQFGVGRVDVSDSRIAQQPLSAKERNVAIHIYIYLLLTLLAPVLI